MRNEAWDEVTEIRAQQRSVLATFVAEYLRGDSSEPGDLAHLVGKIAGAIHLLDALPYARGANDEIDRAIEAAHHLNRGGRSGRTKHPCGCGTRQRCRVEGVDVGWLLRRLAEMDPYLRIDPDEDEDDEDRWSAFWR